MEILTIPTPIGIGVVSAVCWIALWRGGWRERLIAALQQLMVLNGHYHFCPIFSGLSYDLIDLAACLICTARSSSYWTVWASAAAFLSVVIRPIYFATPEISQWAFMSAEWAFAYASSAALLWGALTYRREFPLRVPRLRQLVTASVGR